MGGVYRAFDLSGNRDVALKILSQEQRTTIDGALRFRREFHTLSQLHHPRVVDVFEFGVDNKNLYYTMELLDGRDLRDLGRVPAQQACRVVRDLASALAFLHSRRLVHRDISLRNIRCTSDGRAKLIDFGLLAVAGTTVPPSGTAPFMSPETLRGQPVDHRSDLFAIGAVLYWLLTGKLAFPAKTFDALPSLWGTPLALPSSLAPGIPPALDELVIALLSTNPLARPAAAEVIDRLCAIGHLDPAPELAAARGYLASTVLVGREKEMHSARRWFDRAASGSGRSVVVRGPTGIGKTRVLKELHLEAQMRGALVANVNGETDRGAYGALREAMKSLIACAPDLMPKMSDLPELIGGKRASKGRTDPNEDRLRVQSRLTEWLTQLAEQRLVVLLFDDIQRCDEASAAVLASLAREARHQRLMLVCALRTDEPARAASPIAALGDTSFVLELQGLTVDDLEHLVATSFGAAPYVRRLAAWIHRVSAGTPLYATELLRELVERGVIAYLDGTWVIADAFEKVTVPVAFADAIELRLTTLSDGARALGEALGLHGREIGLDECVRLAGDSADSVFAALDELVHNGLLLGTEDRYRFSHDGVREAFLRQLPDDRRRALHLKLGSFLVENGVDDTLAIGWHLVRGGDPLRGADYLERGGRALFDAQSMIDSITPLEAVVQVLEAHGGSRTRCAEIRVLLLTAGTSGNHEVVERQAKHLIDELRVSTGLDTARRLGRILGPRVALVCGVATACARWLFTSPSQRGANPIRGMQWLFIAAASLAVRYGEAFDVRSFDELLELIRPASVFRTRIPHAVFLMIEAMRDFIRAKHAPIMKNIERAIWLIQHDRLAPISDMERKSAETAARMLPVFIAVSRQDPGYEQLLAKAEQYDLRFYTMQGCQARVAYYRSRGEEHDALEWESRAETLALQLGSLRYVRAWMNIVSAMAYALTRDVMGLKRSIHGLAASTADGFGYEAPLELARGEYYRERGELELSRKSLERCLETVPAEISLIIQPALAALAETYLALGELEQARDTALRAIARSSARDTAMIANEVRSQRVMALVEAACGQPELATARLDDIIARTAALASPSLCGMLHDARARIAFTMGDVDNFTSHTDRAAQLFLSSRNPVLIARGERLAQGIIGPHERAEPHEVLEDAVTISEVPAHITCTTVLERCRGPSERAARALEVLVQSTSAESGYLFIQREARLIVVAPSTGETPSAEIREAAADSARGEVRLLGVGSAHPLRVNAATSDVVGSAVLIAGAVELRDPDPLLLQVIAQALVDPGANAEN